MNITTAQYRILELCSFDGLTLTGKIIYRISADTLQLLEDRALIKYRPYARVPRWTLTRDGHAALRMRNRISFYRQKGAIARRTATEGCLEPLQHCPYTPGSDAAEAWIDGWNTADAARCRL